MLYRTHIAFAFFLSMLFISILSPKNQILFLVIVLITSLLPDIDHPKSKLGKHLKVIGFLFEHRGFFHSLLFLGIVYIVLFYYFPGNIYFIPFVIGYTSHLFLDGLTRKGIMPFHPFSRMRFHGFVHTGSFLEKIFLILLVLADIYLLFTL